MEPGWMEMLKRKLMGGGQPEPQAPMPPMQGQPWEQPLMDQPPMGGQPMPQAPMPPDMGAVGAMPGQPMSPMDEALLTALAKKRFNQQFAGATGNPIPR